MKEIIKLLVNQQTLQAYNSTRSVGLEPNSVVFHCSTRLFVVEETVYDVIYLNFVTIWLHPGFCGLVLAYDGTQAAECAHMR